MSRAGSRIGSLLLITLTLTTLTLTGAGYQDPDPDYDRLDGTGASGKKVHVIEWEGNLEVHVYPAGSLAGLALKLDKKNKAKPVMVIGYRFDTSPKQQLIRRAILGIDLREGFKVFKDPTAIDYDKIIISNNGLSSQVVAYRLDPEPSQLYPDGHPALAKKADEETPPRTPASSHNASATRPDHGAAAESEGPDDNGTIQPFFMKENGKHRY